MAITERKKLDKITAIGHSRRMKNDDLYACLYALFSLSRANLPTDAGTIARWLNLSATEVAVALIELEHEGLVDASRARLTMAGLVVAVSSKCNGSAKRLKKPRLVVQEPVAELPIAAQPCLAPRNN